MTHLIIVQGLSGHKHSLNSIKEYLETIVNVKVAVFVDDVFKIWNGIESEGNRLTEFVLDEIYKIEKEYKPITLSFISHSIGGMYARVSVGILEKRGFLENRVTPNVFATVATPHLGIKDTFDNRNVKHRMLKFLAGKTGAELLSEDDKHILHRLCDVGDEYMLGLSRFKRRIAYGNISNDDKVSFSSACICGNLPNTATLTRSFPEGRAIIINELKCFTNPLNYTLAHDLSKLTWIRKGVVLSEKNSHSNLMYKNEEVLRDLLGFI